MGQSRRVCLLLLVLSCLLCFATACAGQPNSPVSEVTPPPVTEPPVTPPPVTPPPVTAPPATQPPVTPSPEDRQVANQIIRELILCNGDLGRVDEARNEQLFAQLETVDGRKAEIWRGIIDYLNATNTENFVNQGELPDGLPDDDRLCLVVLGYELNYDGSMKPELLERLRVAKNNLEKYPNALVLVAGGGTAYMNPLATEAERMSDWLRVNGIDPGRIIVENQSMDTVANAENSLRILETDYPQVTDLAMISSDYHVPWGSVVYYAQIAYNAYLGDGTKQFNIVSNASSGINTLGYSKEAVISCQRMHLWEIAKKY